MTYSPLEESLLAQIRQAGMPEPCREMRFHPIRRWRFDMAWPALRLAVEVEGGTKGKSRHTNRVGYERDCRKYNEAVLHGWQVLRFTGDMIASGEALEMLMRAMGESQFVTEPVTKDVPCKKADKRGEKEE